MALVYAAGGGWDQPWRARTNCSRCSGASDATLAIAWRFCSSGIAAEWMARLAHRYLKASIAEAAHVGDESDIHTTHPVPAYAYGAELGHGEGGKF